MHHPQSTYLTAILQYHNIPCPPWEGNFDSVANAIFLCVAHTRIVLFRSEMTCVRAPMIGMIARDPKRLQQRFELEKNWLCRKFWSLNF